MAKLEDAIGRIKRLECPTGDLGYRVAGILEDYEIANSNEVTVNREERLDRDGAEAYRAKIPSNTEKSIMILAKSGSEDYVAKVIDAYMN
ncbi:hypothetical protein SAMN05446037_103027 [Anaerovirgula multivorans]|uniref:Uncharacterized protein n=1 Tax=Anaerovirgula multivorans TaxID=312168 RepID=A0A239ISZ7_9FIRM|nr:hypothetical protein [Anaerovirgula multivorans]SNS96512.1 hypothetical protein SAMN05446037_103027 [Anaerovirgula multivorans]